MSNKTDNNNPKHTTTHSNNRTIKEELEHKKNRSKADLSQLNILIALTNPVYLTGFFLTCERYGSLSCLKRHVLTKRSSCNGWPFSFEPKCK
jgi:hypothetical protein